jgi:hypothetical protein
MGLNHMNGRVQDAANGRFLSPDPFINDPDNTQNYNRYSYVYNNPATFTDPSGFDIVVHVHFCISRPYIQDTWTVSGGTFWNNDNGGWSNWGGTFSVSSTFVGYVDGNCVDFDIFVPNPTPPSDPCEGFPQGPGTEFMTPDEAGIDMMKSAKMYDQLDKLVKPNASKNTKEHGSWVHQVKGTVLPRYTWEPLTTGTAGQVAVTINPNLGTVYGWGHSHGPDKNKTYNPKSKIDQGNMELSDKHDTTANGSNDIDQIKKMNNNPNLHPPGKGVTAYLLTPDGAIKKFEDGKYNTAGETLCAP